VTHHAAHATGSGHRSSERRRLKIAIVLTGLILLVEAVGGVWANSLALLSDAGHVLTDLAALALAYGAFVLASKPATARKTYGWHRIEILAALVNGALLLALSAGILYESTQRFKAPPEVEVAPMAIAAILGFLGNIAVMAILMGGRSNLNLRGAMLHVMGDTLSSMGVILTSILIAFTGWRRADAVMGMIIGLVIIVVSIQLLRQSVDVLLEATPEGIELVEVSDAIVGIEGVREVHDLHIWSITSGMPALSGHVVVENGACGGTDGVLHRIKRMLHERFSITHTTLQLESPDYEEYGEIH